MLWWAVKTCDISTFGWCKYFVSPNKIIISSGPRFPSWEAVKSRARKPTGGWWMSGQISFTEQHNDTNYFWPFFTIYCCYGGYFHPKFCSGSNFIKVPWNVIKIFWKVGYKHQIHRLRNCKALSRNLWTRLLSACVSFIWNGGCLTSSLLRHEPKC